MKAGRSGLHGRAMPLLSAPLGDANASHTKSVSDLMGAEVLFSRVFDRSEKSSNTIGVIYK